MDLSAANLANRRAVRLSRIGMLVCFVLSVGLLIESLVTADNQTVTEKRSEAPS
jgi:hypothetical protein